MKSSNIIPSITTTPRDNSSRADGGCWAYFTVVDVGFAELAREAQLAAA